MKKTKEVLTDVFQERLKQDIKWGEQNHPDGTGHPYQKEFAKAAREMCDNAFSDGIGTWRHILKEEVYEVFAEEDPVKLREELIQVAAVAISWVEAIDRRQ